MKHTSTVLEPSIFHTLVKLVDAEDIANDKIRTHDLALKLNNTTNHLQSQTLDYSQQEQFMFTQSRDLKTKRNLLIKNVPIVIEQTTLSLPVSKNNEMMKINEKLTLDRNLLKNHLYSTFVRPPMIEQKDTIHATDTEIRHELITITKTQIHKTDIALHQETDSAMTKLLLLHNTLDHDKITTKEIPDHTVLLIDLLTDLPMDMTLVIEIDHIPIQEITTILQDIHPPIDHEILDNLDHVYIQIPEINLIQYNHNIKQTQLILCTHVSPN